MQKNNEFLGSEPIGRLLFRLAVPTVIAQLINMLYNVVDRIYIGHIPEVGDLALTGVGVCMPIIMLVSAFAALVSSGGAPRASILLGKRDVEGAERVIGGCFTLLIIISAILSAVLLLFGEELLLAFGASENTVGYAVDYLTVYALGTVFVQLTLGMNAFVTAQGRTAISMLSVIIGAVMNILLDPLFIYVFGMGVRGAAIATVISQAASCLWIVLFLFGKRAAIRLKPRQLLPRAGVVLPCIALGSAAFVMQASESVISVCFNSSLLRYGGDVAVGAMTILTSVMQFAMLPLQGIAQGAQPILSYNYGAKKAERVRKTYRLLLTVSLCYSSVLWLLVMIMPRGFAALFTTAPALLEFTEWALRIYFSGMILFGIQMACQMTFVSLGNALSSVAVAVVRKFVLLLPLIYILPLFFENRVFAVYLAEPVADVIAVTFTAILFFFRFRRVMSDISKSA